MAPECSHGEAPLTCPLCRAVAADPRAAVRKAAASWTGPRRCSVWSVGPRGGMHPCKRPATWLLEWVTGVFHPMCWEDVRGWEPRAKLPRRKRGR